MISRLLRKAQAAIAAMIFFAPVALASGLQLDFRSDARPVEYAKIGVLRDAKVRAASITRLDLLLSKLSLRRADGTWLELPPWHGFYRAHEPNRCWEIPTVPAGTYTGLRFGVGVEKEMNHADPHLLPPEHALHPVANGMHWGWTTGYIFMALEGHWAQDNAPEGVTGGYSYHLGNDENFTTVEVLDKFDLRQPTTIVLEMDLGALLSGIDISKDGESTHSRQQDSVVKALRNALARAFRFKTTAAMSDKSSSPVTSVPPSTHLKGVPFPFAISAQFPQVTMPADNVPTVEGVALGEVLFHDKRLSKDLTLSCASCHDSRTAFADAGKTISVGVGGRLGDRNAMPIFNTAWQSEFFWDGRAKGLRNQAMVPIQDPNEMDETLPEVERKLGEDAQIRAHFERVFGDRKVTAERVGLALEQFMLTLVSQDSKFDRMTRGQDTFTSEEKRGFELFLTEHDPFRGLLGADCFHCHGGALFTNNHYMNNGLAILGNDVGREKVTRLATDRGKFKTPSLRNVAITGPYMHDGRFQTLEEVIDHYDHGIVRSETLDPNIAKHPPQGLQLSAQDKQALIAFLKTLTDIPRAPMTSEISKHSLH